MIKINMGCGWRNFGKEWIHIDGGDYDHLDYHDITKLNFEDNSVDLIYASHVLEYFDQREVTMLLKEWKRVLKPNGELRIAVPDFESMTNLYHRGVIQLKDILGPLYGRMPMGDITIYHKTTYDYNSLETLLNNLGFSHVKKYDWKQYDIHVNHDDHSQAYLNPRGDKVNGTLISLNITCNKIG